MSTKQRVDNVITVNITIVKTKKKRNKTNPADVQITAHIYQHT